MNKKKRNWIIAGAAAALIVGGTAAYGGINNFLGNNVEIESVMSGNTEPSGEAQTVSSEELTGAWALQDESKVYWSITTSQETVNFVNDAVTGAWSIDFTAPESMSAEGIMDMSALDSGNAQRDDHLQESDFFDVAAYPEATFTADTFTGLPEEWTEGEVVPVTIEGTMTVRGMEKDVTFFSEVSYQEGNLLLSGQTEVTFDDFGMENPHNVVVETENDVNVRLELVLSRS
ncbi:YceI family protein [Paenibacillus sp. PDC88]|uniref:YceI family protein n=1 Tax=Paenibacillus sp. PDC88 TaxID=1884375 RepID=UPI0008952D7C|nr:YceI family protein [Paenibacillus sp. PDC88]SDX81094.1 Polyisoprenoid-binding protein YceI [Paenibacillus sp. PDC88]